MKKTAVIAALAVVTAVLPAETLYVTARICPVFKESSTASGRLGLFDQGDELSVIGRSGNWLRVKNVSGTVEGWVQELFTGSTPSVRRSDTSDTVKNISSVVTRKRASAYTTSAAATRGLTGENVRERGNLAFSEYDLAAAAWLDTFIFGDDEIVAFAERENILPR